MSAEETQSGSYTPKRTKQHATTWENTPAYVSLLKGLHHGDGNSPGPVLTIKWKHTPTTGANFQIKIPTTLPIQCNGISASGS